MVDWFSYSLTDFLLFSPNVYWALITEQFVSSRSYWLAWQALLTISLLYGLKNHRWTLYPVILGMSYLLLALHFYFHTYAQLNPHAKWLGYTALFQAIALASLCFKRQPGYEEQYITLAVLATLTTPVIGWFTHEVWQFGVIGAIPITTLVLTFFWLRALKAQWFYWIAPALLFTSETFTFISFALSND